MICRLYWTGKLSRGNFFAVVSPLCPEPTTDPKCFPQMEKKKPVVTISFIESVDAFGFQQAIDVFMQ